MELVEDNSYEGWSDPERYRTWRRVERELIARGYNPQFQWAMSAGEGKRSACVWLYRGTTKLRSFITHYDDMPAPLVEALEWVVSNDGTQLNLFGPVVVQDS